MVRSMAGHGLLITRYPLEPSDTGVPSMLTTSGTMPGNGRVAEPGFVAIAPGMGVIMICPVSVCHQVSTIGQRFSPITSRYHIHASGPIGSPTVPSSRRLLGLCFRGHSSPHLLNVQIALGSR